MDRDPAPRSRLGDSRISTHPPTSEAVQETTVQESVRNDNFDIVVVTGLFSVLILLRLAYVWTASIDDVIFRLTDDAYYYLNTARNIALGFGITFDRINATNGFHPLWMLCLLPVFRFFLDSLEIPVRIVSTGLGVMAGITAWLAFRTIRTWLGRDAALGMVPLLGVPFIVNHLLDGMETGLLLLLMFTVITLDQAWNVVAGAASVRRAVSFGLLLGLVFLSRLDSVFVIFCLFCAWGRQCLLHPTRTRWTGFVAGVIGCGALAVSFVLWNIATFGHAMPISGAIKSSFPVAAISFRTFRSPAVLLHGIGMIGALSVLAWQSKTPAPGAARTTERMCVPPILTALWIGSLMHFIYEVLFTRWGLEWWHFASHIPGLLFLVAFLLRSMMGRLSLTCYAVLVGGAALLVAGSVLVETRLRGDHHQPWLAAARWAHEHTNEDAVFAMTDSGLFGFFSGRRTVNLDGVINSYGFQKSLSEGRLGEFLSRSRVSHLADYEVPTPVPPIHRVRLRAGLFAGPISELQMSPSAEVYRSNPYEDYLSKLYGRGPISFVIWDFTKVRLIVHSAEQNN